MGKVFAGESPEGAAVAVDAAARAALLSGDRGEMMGALALDDGARAQAAAEARTTAPLLIACAAALAADACWVAWAAVQASPIAAAMEATAGFAVVALAAKPAVRWTSWRRAAKRRSPDVNAVRAALAAPTDSGTSEEGARAARAVRMTAEGTGCVQVVCSGNVVNGVPAEESSATVNPGCSQNAQPQAAVAGENAPFLDSVEEQDLFFAPFAVGAIVWFVWWLLGLMGFRQ